MILLLALLHAASSCAASETHYAATLKNEVEPYVQARLRLDEFSGVDGVRIKFGTLQEGRRGTVVIVPGRTEWSGTHTELIYDFAKEGYSVAVIDHRGQGRSGRMIPTDAGHVERFQDFVDDFESFLDRAVLGKLPAPYFLIGDSMGGAISLLYLEKHPQTFAAVALAAPMLKIKTSPFSESVAFGLASFLRRIGWGARYAFTTGAHDFQARFEDNNFTHSRARFDADMARVGAEPATAMGGPSVNWVYEALLVSRRLIPLVPRVPVLLFEAGEDAFVEKQAQDEFCARAPRCQKVLYPRAYHSLLIESDAVRADLVTKTLAHFREHGSEAR